MSLNANEYLDAFTASLGDSPAVPKLKLMKEHFNKSLYHEFSVVLLDVVQSYEEVRRASLDIHEQLLVKTRSNISSDIYIKLVYLACSTSDGSAESSAQLMTILDGGVAEFSSSSNEQGVRALHCIRALIMMSHGPSLDAKRILTEVEDGMKKTPLQDLNVVLQAFFSRATARLHELMCDYDSFYSTAFLFATYGSQAGVPILPAEVEAVAYRTAIAALLAKKIYNFGQLLNFEPFAKALKESKDSAWALELVEICNAGDVAAYHNFMDKHKATIDSIDDLNKARNRLINKVRLMALLHLIFHTAADKRQFSFSTLAERCSLQEAEVEPMLLSAFALHLVEGKLDGLEQTVDITWVQPRVLSLAEVKQLADNIGAWRKVVAETVKEVSAEAGELTK